MLNHYERITTSTPLPSINPDSPEELLRLVVAIALAGEYTPFGHVHGVFLGVNALCEFLDIDHIADTRNVDKGELSQAILVTCAAVPDRKVSECVRILRRTIRVCGTVEYDLRRVRDFDSARVHKSIQILCNDPIPALYILGAIDVPHLPLPSGGGAAVLLRLALLDDLTPEVIIGGFSALREAAREALEGYPAEVFGAVEHLSRICPEGCPICHLNQVCPHLCDQEEGWFW